MGELPSGQKANFGCSVVHHFADTLTNLYSLPPVSCFINWDSEVFDKGAETTLRVWR
jgi:hypothetical protein